MRTAAAAAFIATAFAGVTKMGSRGQIKVPPCTGLYCEDNPLGNPCPCPVWKPCKHDNVPDGHCMYRVIIAGVKVDDDTCAHPVAGTWNATFAGKENLGQIPSGHCLCTAGSSDIYEAVKFGNCNRTSPQWCDKDHNGNACPPRNCEYTFTAWTGCTKTCGGGTQTRTALVTKPPKASSDGRVPGKACPQPEVRKCNVAACPLPTPAPAPTPSNKCDTKAMNKKHQDKNHAHQVQNMREGLQAASGTCRDRSGERCNRVEETTNLREQKLNTHLLSCSGVPGCKEETVSMSFSYSK